MSTQLKMAFILDPLDSLNAKKDSSIAMIESALKKDWQCYSIQMNDLFVEDEIAYAKAYPITLSDHFITNKTWYNVKQPIITKLEAFNVIQMRKEPPFDMEFVFATYILEKAEKKGTWIINKPQSLRDANEKMFITNFPHCIPSTLITRSADDIKTFLNKHDNIILKPLDGNSGSSIFKLTKNDPNINVIIETITQFESRYTMIQRFIPEIAEGDKRILLVNGKAPSHSVARIAKKGETRANLAKGAQAVVKPLTDRDRWLIEQVAPTLQAKGIVFCGLDVIGEYITEINVTCPTCVRELDFGTGYNAADELMNFIELNYKK
ncbi:glutathione synthase [Thiotrichales bacterium 19S3-7]|nr:glutathione synthase [Thiotrichales bacterium 19S3-7]MCF6801239.1 glutathione synthase [Thiotrichales bacterium 19S3-11]